MSPSFIKQFERLADVLTQHHIEYALCGGVAVNIYGHVRSTNDIDLLVLKSNIPQIFEVLKDLGFTFTSGPVPFQAGTAHERRLYRATQIDDLNVLTVDLIEVTPILQNVWDAREIFTWRNRDLTIVSLEGLAYMKRLANRYQDLADLKNLGLEPENDEK